MLATRTVLLAIAMLSVGAAEKLPKPERVTMPPTPEQRALIREGVTLHDQSNFEAAIGKYKLVLAENPWEVTALHELSFTLFASKKFEDALATARLGAQCKSNLLPRFYMMIGNALDELGKGADAIEIYESAIQENPGVALL